MEDKLRGLFRSFVKEEIIPEVRRLYAYSLISEIDERAPLRKGSEPGPSGACVLVGISNSNGFGGDFLEDEFNSNPPGIPVGEYVADLVEKFSEGSMNAEMEEWRLECIAEIRASLDILEESIRARLPFAERIDPR